MSESNQSTSIEARSAGVITQEWLKDYAEVGADENPIHQDAEVARAMGLPDVIAHGMLVTSLLHSRAEELIRQEPALQGLSIRESRTRFRSMTLLGDEVFTRGTWQVLDGGGARLDLQALTQKDEVTVTAQIELRKGTETGE